MKRPTHIPVLHSDDGHSPVLSVLKPLPGERVLDVTLGLGSHAEAFLKAVGATGFLCGLDTDSDNLSIAKDRLKAYEKQIDLRHENFRSLREDSFPPFDIIFADLGLSSPHIDRPERGFSFRFDGPLDPRFDQTKGATAADFLHDAAEDDIADVLFRYGELRESRRLAKRLHDRSINDGIRTTFDLKKCIEIAAGYRAPKILPQVFQALRIHINGELGALEHLLIVAPLLLKTGGRFGVISYHSLEDRMVKQAFKQRAEPDRDPVRGGITKAAPFEILTKKPVKPSDEEVRANPRSRSAVFRAIRRI